MDSLIVDFSSVLTNSLTYILIQNGSGSKRIQEEQISAAGSRTDGFYAVCEFEEELQSSNLYFDVDDDVVLKFGNGFRSCFVTNTKQTNCYLTVLSGSNVEKLGKHLNITYLRKLT